MYISVAFIYIEVTLTLIPFQFHSELEELYLENFIKVDHPCDLFDLSKKVI